MNSVAPVKEPALAQYRGQLGAITVLLVRDPQHCYSCLFVIIVPLRGLRPVVAVAASAERGILCRGR
jgi:hypothetical protein